MDLWAVGIVLFVILSGRFCFYGDTNERFMGRLRAGVRFPESEWGTISEGARSLIRGLLRPDPATRLTASQALRHPWLQPARDRPGDPVPHMPSMGTAAGYGGGGSGGSGGDCGGGGGGAHHSDACDACRGGGGDRRGGFSGNSATAPLPPIKPSAFGMGGRPPRRAGGSIGGGGLNLSMTALEKRAATATAYASGNGGGGGRYGTAGGGGDGGGGADGIRGGRVTPLPPMPEESMSLRLGQYMPPSLDAERTIAGFAVNVPPAKWRGAGGAIRTD